MTPCPALVDLERCEEGFFKWPTKAVKSLGQDGVSKPRLFGPLDHCLRNASVGDQPVGSGVARLLLFGRPAAIVGGIWPIVVYAVKRVFVARAGAHVLQELFERAPLFADPDSTSTIVWKVRVAGVGRPIPHGGPSSVLRGDAGWRGRGVSVGPMATALARLALRQVANGRWLGQGSARTTEKNGSHSFGLPVSHPQPDFSYSPLPEPVPNVDRLWYPIHVAPLPKVRRMVPPNLGVETKQSNGAGVSKC